MKIHLAFIIACLMVYSCNTDHKNNTETTADMNPQFDKYKENFVEELWKIYPGWASNQVYHKYDSVLTVPDDAQRGKEIAFAKANLDSLKSFDLNSLSDNNKTDYYMIENQLNQTVWEINEQKDFE